MVERWKEPGFITASWSHHINLELLLPDFSLCEAKYPISLSHCLSGFLLLEVKLIPNRDINSISQSLSRRPMTHREGDLMKVGTELKGINEEW